MSTLNKFIIFQCDTCNRQTELQIEGDRIDPIRCIITYKCRGKLSRVGESASKKFLVTPPVAGLQDYIPRGTIISSAPVIPPEQSVSMNTSGGAGMLSMAVLRRVQDSGTPPTGTHSYLIYSDTNDPVIINTSVSDYTPLATNVKILLNIFPISPSVLQSTTYTYLETGEVHVVSGPDNSPSSIVLRFSAENNISVYINGIELDPSAYVISIPNQSITFTPAIYEFNNVINVIVYNSVAANVASSSIIPLEFDVLDPTINLPPPFVSELAFLNVCAWGNYNAVNLPEIGERYLMHCTDLSALSKDVSYGVDGVQIVIGTPVPAGSFVVGITYTIYFVGNTIWTNVGVNGTPDVGVEFVASGPGDASTTGTATVTAPINVALSEVNLLLAKDPYSFQDKELNAYLNGSSFNSFFSFTFSQDKLTGIYKLTAPEQSLTQLLHSMIPSEPISASLFSAQSTSGASTASINVSHKYIIGPT